MLASLKLAIVQFACGLIGHGPRKHVDTVRIHAEAAGYWGTQIDYSECQDCKARLATSRPMECVATFD